jgi:hypothetical protein
LTWISGPSATSDIPSNRARRDRQLTVVRASAVSPEQKTGIDALTIPVSRDGLDSQRPTSRLIVA